MMCRGAHAPLRVGFGALAEARPELRRGWSYQLPTAEPAGEEKT